MTGCILASCRARCSKWRSRRVPARSRSRSRLFYSPLLSSSLSSLVMCIGSLSVEPTVALCTTFSINWKREEKIASAAGVQATAEAFVSPSLPLFLSSVPVNANSTRAALARSLYCFLSRSLSLSLSIESTGFLPLSLAEVAALSHDLKRQKDAHLHLLSLSLFSLLCFCLFLSRYHCHCLSFSLRSHFFSLSLLSPLFFPAAFNMLNSLFFLRARIFDERPLLLA